MTIQVELREKALRIAHEARAKLDSIKSDNSNAAEVEAEFDRMMKDSDALEARAKRHDELDAREAALNVIDERRDRQTRTVSPESIEERTAQAFRKLIANGSEYGLTGEERALILRDAQSVGVNADGGYAVPTSLHSEIIKAATVFGPMLDASIFDVSATASGNPLNFAVSTSTRKARLIGEGVAANAVAEHMGQITLNAYKLTTDAAVASREFLQDAGVNVEEWLVGQLAESYGLGANDYLTNGTGSNQPNGIVTALASGALTSAANTTVTESDLLALQYGVNSAYRSRGRYMISSKLEQSLRSARDTTGQPIWIPGVTAGAPNTIHGKPYFINDDMPDIGSSPSGKVAAVFGDMKSYKVRVSRSMGITRLNELFALSDQVGWIGFARIDGDIVQTAGLKALKVKA